MNINTLVKGEYLPILWICNLKRRPSVHLPYSFILICWTFLLTSCVDSPESSLAKEINIKKDKIEPIKVSVATSRLGQFQYIINSNGKVKAQNEQIVSTEINGKLVSSKAKTGKFFSTGSIIAEIETTPIQLRLEKAKLSLFNNQKEYESQLLGYEYLLKGKTESEAEAIRTKLRISSGVSATELEIREIQYELNKAIIRAPFNGVLSDVKIQGGETLKSEQELFHIYDNNNLFLEVNVLESDVILLKSGMPAEVSPISSSENRFTAIIDEIDPYIAENGMANVKLKIGKPIGRFDRIVLYPGMNCSAMIKIPMGQSILVPKDAIAMRNGIPVVFSLESGKAKWHNVKVGRDNGIEAEIINGLQKGMKIITTNNLQLAHDAPVEQNDSTHEK
ncbi:efflux RND transporter periplasmic adaptor subunit [Flavihumibacter petaseus]|uniref:Putative RND-type efflux pump membrane fusion protein n=1 Tax=Flavihumibacter petaseus NBRC 106054 TaxID=1220578 RepID=A0A0E9MXV5_9BACT|nr:efflux RND transporter periplasmic adaptor subunit [Flavihumibacter petaseus]GAO41955.1 putative RND-type efflux pump membrane fusion protein [Flavihumibacter petaseus NBRC 106054]